MSWRRLRPRYDTWICTEHAFQYTPSSRLLSRARDNASRTFIVNRNLSSQSGPSSRTICRHDELRNEPPNVGTRSVTIAGLVRSIRKQKKIAFVHVSDGTTLEPLQAILNTEQAKDITNGSYVQLSGEWTQSTGKGQAYELQVENVDALGEASPEDFPIQKKSLSPGFLRTLPHLRVRTPFYSLLSRTRSQLIASIHDFYSKARSAGPAFHVHPPLITSSDCEGAGEVFTIQPKVGSSNSVPADQKEKHYFRLPKYLTVSSQLHLEAYSAELGDVWALSPTFRAEESDTSRHLSEFYMLEAEFRNMNNVEQLMGEAEELLKYVVQFTAESVAGRELLSYYNNPKYSSGEDDPATDIEQRWENVLTAKWQVVTYADAIKHLQHHHDTYPSYFEHAPNHDTGLQLEHERHLVSYIAGEKPLFITHYPKDIKPFYMLPSGGSTMREAVQPANTVACFDLLFPFGTAELVGGSLREHRLPQLISTMREKGLLQSRYEDCNSGNADLGSAYPHLEAHESLGSLQWYADLRRFGSQPHGGFGIGFDRLLAYITGVPNVRDTVGFPRHYGRADC